MTNQAPPKRGRGRPPNAKLPSQHRRGFNFRITDKMRQQLNEAVKVSGRSLASEVEYRLAMSFVYETAIDEKTSERMRRRAEAYRDETLPSPFSPEATQGPLTPELVERHAAVDRGVTAKEMDERLRKMREEIMQDLANALLKPRKDDAA